MRHWRRHTWAAFEKKARREGHEIVFIDESGLSERPTRVRTWAPKEPPIIDFYFNWRHASSIAALTRREFYIRLHDGSMKKKQIIEFLQGITAQMKRPLLVIWDGLRSHHSRQVREYVNGLDGQIRIEFLPAYAPDFNPVEYLWAWLKRHALANYCPNNLNKLKTKTRHKLWSAQKRPSIIAACWKHAGLW